MLHFSVGGTTGAIFTCPLEVVKTRLQSSNSGFPTCDGPSCDYVPIRTKKEKTKLTVGYHQDASGSGASGSSKQSGVRNYSTLTQDRTFAQDVKRLKNQVNSIEFSTSNSPRYHVLLLDIQYQEFAKKIYIENLLLVT